LKCGGSGITGDFIQFMRLSFKKGLKKEKYYGFELNIKSLSELIMLDLIFSENTIKHILTSIILFKLLTTGV